MTVVETSRRPGPPSAERGSSPKGGRKRTSTRRVPVERVLPPPLLDELRQAVSTVDRVSPGFVAETHVRFDIEGQFGVSRRRLGNCLRRLHTALGESPAPQPDGKEPPTADSVEGWGERVRSHRRRQASVAAILDQTFGRLAKCSPDLWERRAYLMLVGLVYERLATNEIEIPTDELVALAKILAENRRAEARHRDNHRQQAAAESPGQSTTPGTGELPERFADVVRQVYGTNFQAAEAPTQ